MIANWGVAAALSAGLLLAGCGQAAEGQAPAQRPASSLQPADVVDRPAETKRLEKLAQASFEQWAGSPEDHQAGDVIVAYANNAGQDECVRARGFEPWHDWRYAIGGSGDVPIYEQSLVFLRPVRWVTFEHALNAPHHWLEKQLRKTPPAPIDKILDACSSRSDFHPPLLGRIGEEEVGELIRPPVIEDLTRKWREAQTEATEDLPSDRQILRCMSTSTPKPPLAAVKPGKQGQRWFDVVRDAIPAPELVATDSAQWRKALAAEAALVEVIWGCTSESYAEAVRRLPAIVEEFESRNAKDIATARDSWAKVRELATKMGWRPDDPLAGLKPHRASAASPASSAASTSLREMPSR